jgi:hypothetical protein
VRRRQRAAAVQNLTEFSVRGSETGHSFIKKKKRSGRFVVILIASKERCPRLVAAFAILRFNPEWQWFELGFMQGAP